MKTKKIVALLLSVAMVVTAVPFAVLADETETSEESEAVEIEVAETEETDAAETEEEEAVEAEPEAVEAEPEAETEEIDQDLEEISEELEAPTYDDATIVHQGQAGATSTWTLDNKGKFVITGTGMVDKSENWSPYKESIRDVIIDNGITEIEAGAFSNCVYLKTVALADGVVTIGKSAFEDCSALEYINIPDSVNSIGDSAFYGCRLLGSVGIEPTSNLREIAPSAFRNCESLSTILIPRRVKKVGACAFQGCVNLSIVDIRYDAQIEEFGMFAFSGCENLESLTFPIATSFIGEGIFNGCTSLSEVYLLSGRPLLVWEYPAVAEDTIVHANERLIDSWNSWIGALGAHLKVDLCGSYAIWNYDASTKTLTISGHGDMKDYMSSYYDYNEAPWRNYADDIKKVVIGNEITSIGKGAFGWLENLEEVDFEANSQVKYIWNSAFIYDINLTTITIPSSVERFFERSFAMCTNLETVNIDKDSSLDQIAGEAFAGCGKLNGMIIPRNVRFISDDAFIGCEGMTDIYSYADPSNKLPNQDFFYYDYRSDDFRTENSPFTKLHIPVGMTSIYTQYCPGIRATIIDDITEMGDGVEMLGHSVSLKGDIGVNFFLELADDILNDQNAYLLFTLADGTTTKILVSEAATDTETVPGKSCKVFQFDVDPVQMGDNIAAQIYMGDDTARGETHNYTVRQYIDEIIEHRNLYPGKVQNLVKAMASYGAYAQVYFNYPDAATAAANLEKYKFYFESRKLTDHLNKFADGSYIAPNQFDHASLDLQTEVNLRLWFKDIPDGTKFMLDLGDDEYVDLQSRRSGDQTLAIINDIPAKDLDSFYRILIKNEDAGLDLVMVYSPMNYCYSIVHSEQDAVITENLQNLVKALHFYNYFASMYANEI